MASHVRRFLIDHALNSKFNLSSRLIASIAKRVDLSSMCPLWIPMGRTFAFEVGSKCSSFVIVGGKSLRKCCLVLL